MLETGHLFPSPPIPTASHTSDMGLLPRVTTPSLPAQGVAGPSTWFHQQQKPVWGDNGEQQEGYYTSPGNRRGVAKRSSSSWQKRGKLVPVFATESVINDHGLFNGSCANTQLQSSPLHTMEGTCASYYPDVTVYCCSGVRGTLRTIPWGIQGEESVLSSIAAGGSATSSSTSSSSTSVTSTATEEDDDDDDDTTEEPLCETTNYADALACFKLTAETNCKTGQSGLFGLCNSVGADTSTVTTSLSSTSIQSSDAAKVQGWKSRWGGMLLVTALLLVTQGV